MGDIIGGFLNFAGGLMNTIQGSQVAQENLKAQEDVLDWQKEAQATTWQREDTAVQRRVKDLVAAGLSPTLAAGSAASSSGPISLRGPQLDISAQEAGISRMSESAQVVMSLLRMKADIDKTNAETELVRYQKEKTAQEWQNAAQAGRIGAQQMVISEETMDAEISRIKSLSSKAAFEAEAARSDARYAESRADRELIGRYRDRLELEIRAQYGMDLEAARVAAQNLAVKLAEKDLRWYAWNRMGAVGASVVRSIIQ